MHVHAVGHIVGGSAFPDICARLPEGECRYIRKGTIASACDIANMLYFLHSALSGHCMHVLINKWNQILHKRYMYRVVIVYEHECDIYVAICINISIHK